MGWIYDTLDFLWFRHRFDTKEFVESRFRSGMEPAKEAGNPPFAAPATIWAVVATGPGALLACVAALALGLDGTYRTSVVLAVAGFLGAPLGAVLGGTLRGFEEAFRVLPAIVPFVVGATLGAAAAIPTFVWPGIPRVESLIAGALVGLLLATLLRVFASRLP